MHNFKRMMSLVILVGIALFLNCTTEPDNTAISSDGVEIRFDVQGEGETALVFVHGWCCDKSYWDAQVSHFAKKYKVVTIDLAGHGESGLNRSQWTIKAYGDDVEAVVNKLDLDRVVLIGHSLGGLVILEAAQLITERTIGLVAVDVIFNIEMKNTQEEIDGFIAALQTSFSETIENLVRQQMFTPQSDSAIVEKIATDMSAAPPEVGLRSIETEGGYIDYFINYSLPALQKLKPPLTLINSDSNPTEIEINNRYLPSLKTMIMSGVGHFVMIEDPETFNRLLEETVVEYIR